MAARRRWLVWATLAYAGVLLATLAGLGLLYRAARNHLDTALGLRLQAVATTAVHLVDGGAIADWSFDPEPATDLLWLTSRLERLRLENDLAEVTLCDRDGYVLASASGRHARGEVDVFWDLDRPAVELARGGMVAVSGLYRVGDIFQKAAYAPVHDEAGAVVGVVTAEGAADFFDTLASLRHGAWATIAVVLALLAVMGALLLGIHRSLERTRASLARQEQLAAMGRMTTGIAHEIRNPLGIIRGSAQHLQRVLAKHGIEDEVAGYIPEEVDRLDRILTGYLAFGTDQKSEFESVDMSSLLRRTTQLLSADLATTDVSVDIAEPSGKTTVEGDPRQLQQILLNLLLNARDAMPEGGRVAVTCHGDGHSIRLTVTDEGSGLGGVSSEQIFTPFWTSKDKGSGLGLAVSRRLARAHGGELTIEDRPDTAGCVATLELPRRLPEHEE